ncbi:helix-turn-helix transcriptional regulator [Acuticoccus sp. MNP-M23]|uniref:helix-turn-helix transcriptional regulator n=1 Tax=Acuticoccus sp. MNP-M23 TaxID=3072793 RepID=UPI0028156DE5|nr:helix-turn-helix transcriptional regulator [Acuticoccus sp. MNP-M23]WMS44558.1 helix-turn-helix transcriptional regulator [Acuticoccus sp. MNP-M23]
MVRRVVPVTRAVYLDAYLKILREIGSPFAGQLHAYGLPEIGEDPSCMLVPVRPSMTFVVAAARGEGIDDLSHRGLANVCDSDLTDQFKAVVRGRPTLLDALRLWCMLAVLEDNCASCWLSPTGNSVRLCSHIHSLDVHPGLEYTQWIQNKIAIDIVRLYLGANWMPRTIAFDATFPIRPSMAKAWPNSRLIVGQKATWIDIPIDALAAPPLAGATEGLDGGAVPDPPREVVGVLRQLIPSYLPEGSLSIERAAKIVGMSVRTLQRELQNASVSYSRLLEEVRYQRASELLHDPAVRITDIAHAVGYDDPSHFSRAFRRFAGTTPSRFRELRSG